MYFKRFTVLLLSRLEGLLAAKPWGIIKRTLKTHLQQLCIIVLALSRDELIEHF